MEQGRNIPACPLSCCDEGSPRALSAYLSAQRVDDAAQRWAGGPGSLRHLPALLQLPSTCGCPWGELCLERWAEICIRAEDGNLHGLDTLMLSCVPLSLLLWLRDCRGKRSPLVHMSFSYCQCLLARWQGSEAGVTSRMAHWPGLIAGPRTRPPELPPLWAGTSASYILSPHRLHFLSRSSAPSVCQA